MIELFFTDGDHVADNVGVRIPTRPQWVGDDARPFAGRDEKKIVAEILNRRIHARRVGDGPKAAPRNIQIATGRPSGRGKSELCAKEDCQTQDQAQSRTLTKALHNTHNAPDYEPQAIGLKMKKQWLA
jgi:hypothetical protein